MKVIVAKPCGYCKGVISAINIAKKTRLENPNSKIYVLGMLVHNKYVSLALEKLNIVSINKPNTPRIELLNEISDGIVIFSAHGVSNDVYKKAQEKNLKIVDATCTDVLKTKEIIINYLKNDYEIIYIGIKNHPEAEGIISNNKHIHLVANINDIDSLGNYEKVFITNQTTMNINEIKDIISKIQKKYPSSIISEEICSATRSRQEAIKNIEYADILYIVGDPNSNNTKNLGKSANSNIKKINYIESIEDIDINELNNDLTVAVTAGASTPTILYQQVIDYLKNYDENNKTLPPINTNIF